MNTDYLSYAKLRAVLFSVSTLLLASCGGGGSSEPAIDTTPASFSFTEQSEIALESDSVSSVITVSGINAEANISIDGGEYSINGGAYTSEAAVITNGQQIRVKHTSSADYSTATTTTLTIGGVSGSFRSTTWAIDTTPASFIFTEQSDVGLESDKISNVITVSGINAYANISIVGGEYSIDGGAYTSTAAVITNGQQVQVKHTSSADYSTETTATLTIGGVPGSFTTLTTPKLSFITGCSELYGVDCTNVNDWTATLWQDDLSEALAERNLSENDILRFPEANNKETVNYSVSGTVSVTDNSRIIHANSFLGVNANQTYTFSTTGLGFPAPEIAPLNSDCETFTLTVNGIPAGDEQSSAVQVYNPNNPHLPVSFERTNLLDTDDSQDYTVTSCDNVVLVILSANGTTYAEFDTANIVDGGNGSVTLLTPSTSPPYNVSIHLGRAEKKGASILPNLGMNQYIFSPEAAALVTYDYQDRGFCSLISEAIQYCINDARRVNATAADSTVNLTFADFSITQLDLNINKRQLEVNWSGTETPTSFMLMMGYFGSVDKELISLTHYVYFSATTLSTVIPPLPTPYQSWLDNGDIEPSIDLLILEKKEKFSALSFSDMISSEHTVSGAQSLLTSPEAYRNPRQILMLKFPE